MGFLRAVFGIVNAELRVQQNIENYLRTFQARSRPTESPCITLYDTYMLMTQLGFHHLYRTPPVVNNICSLYACITPPTCAIALSHQVSISTQPQCYRNPQSSLATEFRRILQELIDEDGHIDLDLLMKRFERINGHTRVYHPRCGIEFGISQTHTLMVFEEWNRDGAIANIIGRA
jgi:hypothetical protein